MTDRNIQQTDGAKLRRRAEGRLAEITGTVPTPGTEADPLRLLHELQVHQVELEMQNAELRQSRNELDAALEKYSDLYDFAPVGYFTLNRAGVIRAANLTGAGLVGVERSRLIGRRFDRFVPAEKRSVFSAFLGKVFGSPAKEACEVGLLKENASELIVQFEGVAAASAEECRIVLIDITDRKRAAAALRLAKDTAESLSHAKDISETLRHAKDTAEALRLANEAADALHLAKDTAVALRLANEAAESLRYAKDTADALRLANEVAEALRYAKDTAETLRLANDAAAATARMKSQFFANMSHELRTPMAGILGMLQLALEEDLAPKPREYLETTLNSARSLLGILNDILDMAKIEAEKLAVEEIPFSPRRCITEAVDIITPEVQRKGLEITVSVADEVPDTLVGDPLRLRQVLVNLVGNAVKFTDEGKVAVSVTAAGTNSAGKSEFTFVVTDTGIGIPEDRNDQLFQVFSQVDPSHSRRYGGTGLGLAICKGLVELMGGTIACESNEGGGSRFSFTIPLAETGLECAAPAAEESFLPETITAPEEERIPRLLLAEDDSTIRHILEIMLKRSHYDLDIAEDGQKAVEMWEKGEYDLVLMDVQMPRLTGFEATQAIREMERKRGGHTPIVAMTAHARKEDEQHCLAAGMDAFISKPVVFKECLQLIGQLVRQKPSGINRQ
ncbi:MAG: response regulator [Steroidobacteraceae bacterium]|nr:response regulator [Deltaproteobacteria bacterium]